MKLFELIRNPKDRHTAVFINAPAVAVAANALGFTAVIAFQTDPPEWLDLLAAVRHSENVKVRAGWPIIDAFGLKACDLLYIGSNYDIALEGATDTIMKHRPLIATTTQCVEAAVDKSRPADYVWGPFRYGDVVFMLHADNL